MSRGFTILGCTTLFLDELQGSGHWIRSQWCFCCASNHVKYLKLHPIFSLSLTSDQWIMERFGLQEAWEIMYVPQAGTHCTRGRQILQQLGSDMQCDRCSCPSLPSSDTQARRLPRLQPCSSCWYQPSHWAWLPREAGKRKKERIVQSNEKRMKKATKTLTR